MINLPNVINICIHTLEEPVIVSKISKLEIDLNATSNKASFGQSKNQSIVVQLTKEGYCRSRVLNLIWISLENMSEYHIFFSYR